MTLLEFVLYALATWRVSSLLVTERGPFDMLVWVRERMGIVHNQEKEPVIYPDRFLPQLFSCVWCVSVWVALLWTAYWFLWGNILVAVPFALSAAAILIDRFSK